MRNSKKDPHYNPHPGSLWINQNRNSLPNDEWVAANANGLVDHDPNITVLMNRLKARGITYDSVALAFITKDSA